MEPGDGDLDHSLATVQAGAIFIAADEPLLVYPSVAAAEADLEAIDVKNGAYSAAFGPLGEPFIISAYDDCVVIEPVSKPKMPEQFKALLMEYLDATGKPADPTESLASLVNKVWKANNYSRWSRDRRRKRLGLMCVMTFAILAAALSVAVG